MLGLYCCKNVSLAAVGRLLIAVASLLVVPGLQDAQALAAAVRVLELWCSSCGTQA